MNPEQFANPLQLLASVKVPPNGHPVSTRFSIEVSAESLIDFVKTIHEGGSAYLIAITGVDPGVEDEHLWVLYHLAQGANVITLRVILKRENPVVPSITSILPAARIFEQELWEMLGVVVVDPGSHTPAYHNHLFLPDDWPEGVFPQRKDFQIEKIS
ncbi:MAG: NADH-quinone oxidoreductase subunit C [Chloroflexota bacterium]|jgi:membrane-bound hydrogenase subunit beta